jgi:alpha-mannosidase
LTAEETVLRIDYDLDWQDPEMLLMAVVSTAYVGSEARYGAPFGSILRGQWPGHSREEAQWSVPASRWMIVMDDAQSEGLGVITEAKYGFTVRDGVVGLNLLRSAYITGADENPEIRDMQDRPRYSDLGRQHVRIALSRFSSDLPMESQPAVLADTLFTPCLPCGGEAVECGLLGISSAPSLAPSWSEPLAPGLWVLRLHETLGRRGTAQVKLAPGWKARAVKMNVTAAEAPSDPTQWQTGVLPVPFGPYQVLSVAFTRIPAPSVSAAPHSRP